MTLDIGKSTAPSMWMERWLSESRLRRYLDVCQGDFARALELYEWNLDLGAVLMKDIAYFEVALRNAYDRIMRERPLDAIISSNRFKAASTQERAIRDYFAMWVTRDFSRFDELFSPCCLYEECYGPMYEGADELHRWIECMLATQHVTAWDIHDMVFAADGQSVTVTWTFTAAEKKPCTFDGCSVIHFDGQGRIDSVREFGAEHERCFPQRREEGTEE